MAADNIRRTFRHPPGNPQSESATTAVRAAEGGTRPRGDSSFDDLVRLAPNTALAIAADLRNIPITPPRPCTGLTEDELLCGYQRNASEETQCST